VGATEGDRVVGEVDEVALEAGGVDCTNVCGKSFIVGSEEVEAVRPMRGELGSETDDMAFSFRCGDRPGPRAAP
jgi:hypothetical protein